MQTGTDNCAWWRSSVLPSLHFCLVPQLNLSGRRPVEILECVACLSPHRQSHSDFGEAVLISGNQGEGRDRDDDQAEDGNTT